MVYVKVYYSQQVGVQNPLLMVDVKVYYSQQDWVQTFLSKSTTVNKIGFKPFGNDGCQSLLQSTRLGSNLLLMVDVKVYYSQQDWVQTLC